MNVHLKMLKTGLWYEDLYLVTQSWSKWMVLSAGVNGVQKCVMGNWKKYIIKSTYKLILDSELKPELFF